MAVVNLPLPYTLVNGQIADASQVMADLLYIANQINANQGVSGTVKVTVNSTLQSYLASVMVAGTGISLTVLNSGGAEQLQVTSTAGIFSLAEAQAAAVAL
jgi:hypothetical protein